MTKQQFYHATFILIIFTNSPNSSAHFFSRNQKPRVLDGTLKCYTCATEPGDSVNMDMCAVGNWKHANSSEKHEKVTQCPRVVSAFCHMAVDTTRQLTIRGCSGAYYLNGDKAHVGCFLADSGDKRVCLCDTELCNRCSVLKPAGIFVNLVLLTTILLY